jgi:hypothetical protein
MNWIQKRKSKSVIIKTPMSKSKKIFLRQIFDGFDADSSGCISLPEFINAVEFAEAGLYKTKARKAMRRKELEDFFHAMDLDGSGDIRFDEFCAAMGKEANSKSLQHEQQGDQKKADIQATLLKHKRSIEIDKISSDNTRALRKAQSFHALYKTHSLMLPSMGEFERVVPSSNELS